MMRQTVLALPPLLWLLGGVILMSQLHVLAPWVWILSLAPVAATVGIAATYWETPAESFLRNRARYLTQSRTRQPYSRSPSLPSYRQSSSPSSVHLSSLGTAGPLSGSSGASRAGTQTRPTE